jgi:hypothetical protein
MPRFSTLVITEGITVAQIAKPIFLTQTIKRQPIQENKWLVWRWMT